MIVDQRITERPWQVIGGAFVLGALVALDQPRVPHNRLARLALATVGAVTLRVLRERALRQVLGVLREKIVPSGA